MPRAVPLDQAPALPATSGLVLVALLVAALPHLGRDASMLELGPSVFAGEPWRLWTSALVHVDWVHLGFNVYWTWVFGALLEKRYGSWRIASFYGLVAPVAAAAEYALFRGGVGLSGVGYGLFGLSWVVSTHDPSMVDAMDRSTVRLFVIWFFFCVGLTITGLMPVANVAHGVGWAMGALVGWTAFAGRWRWLAGAAVVALAATSLVGASLGRLYVNFTDEPAREVERLAEAAYARGDVHRSIVLYERALAFDPDDARARYNYGVALQRDSRLDDALRAYERATAADGEASEYRPAALSIATHLGDVALAEQRYPDAARYLTRAVALDPDDAGLRSKLALARAGGVPAPP